MNNNLNYEPVRKIGKSYTSLTGKMTSLDGNRHHSFESSLERDFIEITNFNPNVSAFIEQPLAIEYYEDGIRKEYTPDFLINYKNDQPGMPFLKPKLVEIKYRKDLKKKWKELRPKFSVALKYCKKNNWDFKIITEVEVRTDYLFNAKFLSYYKSNENIPIEDIDLLFDWVKSSNESTPKEIINSCAKSDRRRAQLLYTLWYMVATYMLQADLTTKLSMNTKIWVSE